VQDQRKKRGLRRGWTFCGIHGANERIIEHRSVEGLRPFLYESRNLSI